MLGIKKQAGFISQNPHHFQKNFGGKMRSLYLNRNS